MKLIYFLTRKIGRAYPFNRENIRYQLLVMCALYGILSFEKRIFFETMDFLGLALLPRSKILQKKITVQECPGITPDGQIEYCVGCPDATVRNKELIPLCMADYLSPIIEK